MPLGLAVLLIVLGVTVVAAALGYLIDKSAAARTRNHTGVNHNRGDKH